MKIIATCDLCGNGSFSFLFKGSDRMHAVEGKYSLRKCNRCGLFFISPRPNQKELEKHYPSGEYYAFKPKKPSKWSFLLYKTFFSEEGNVFLRTMLAPARLLLRSTKIVPRGVFLDVGCGSGEFLLKMKQFGMDCYGVEPGEFDKEFAREHELNISRGTLENVRYQDDFFDVITLNHVFEHLESPSEAVKELYRILKPGGTLIIAVPQKNCLAFKLFGKEWVQLDVPRHLIVPSTKNMIEYARKEKFRVKRVIYNSTIFQFVGSFLYKLDNLKGKKTSLSSRETKISRVVYDSLSIVSLPITALINVLGVGDQVELILEKPA